MELADFIKQRGQGRIAIVAVNWREDHYGLSEHRMSRMLDRIHPTIRVVAGTEETGRVFGGIHSIPAVRLFDRDGKLVFRLGGEVGPDGRDHLRRDRLERLLDGLR